jgi:hypothetical protein
MVWDELHRRVKDKQPTSAQHILYGNSFKTVGKAFQVKLVVIMPIACKSVIKANFEEYQMLNIFLVTT